MLSCLLPYWLQRYEIFRTFIEIHRENLQDLTNAPAGDRNEGISMEREDTETQSFNLFPQRLFSILLFIL